MSGDKFSRRQWRKVQFLVDHYWKRWILEHWPALQRRPKWVKSRRNVQPGDSVIIEEDSVVRKRWALGHVLEVFTEQDGGVRSGRIKTASGVFHHPLQRYAICKKLMVSRGAGIARW